MGTQESTLVNGQSAVPWWFSFDPQPHGSAFGNVDPKFTNPIIMGVFP